jgi:hypothetical protein
MLCHVALVRSEVSEALSSSEASVLTRATWHNIPEDAILHTNILKRNLYETYGIFSVTDENILYLLEMPETEGPVTCELVGDAKANALNLEVYLSEFWDYISSLHRRTGFNVVL